MTEEQMQIAIVKNLGWKLKPYTKMLAIDAGWYGGVPSLWYPPNSKEPKVLPNFESLDEMHKVEKTLTTVLEKSMFANELRKILGFHQHSYFDLAHAESKQRKIAYLRAKKLFK